MGTPQSEMERLLQQYEDTPTQPPPTASSPSPAPAPDDASNAPALAQPDNAQAGGGGGTTPEQMVTERAPDQNLDVAEVTMNAVSGQSGNTQAAGEDAVKQKAEINAALEAQGANPQAAFDKLYEQELARIDQLHKDNQITQRQHKGWKNRWKNIYNTVPKEDMGLFLMDFGMRILAGGGYTEAVGAAGVGALQGQQERNRFRQGQAQQREQQAFDRALARAGLNRQNRPLVESTESGLIERDPETGEWRPIINPETQEPYQREYAGNRAYQGEKVYVDKQLEDAGYTADEIAMIRAGGKPRRVLRQELMADFRMKANAPGVRASQTVTFLDGTRLPMRDLNSAQIARYVDELLNEIYGPETEQRGALQ